jgi:excisionase family DNA binding protein
MNKKNLERRQYMTTNKNYMSVSEVAKMLNISNNKTYDLFHRQDFPSFNIGHQLRVEEQHLINWLNQQHQ